MRCRCLLIGADAVADENERFSSLFWRIQGYVQLQLRIREALLKEHPEWIQPNGECSMCEIYQSRLAELLGDASSREYRSAA